MYSQTTKNSTADADLEASQASKSLNTVTHLPGIHVKRQSVADRYRSRPVIAHGNPLRSSSSVQRRFEKLHRLGPRAGLEFVLEVSEKGLRGEDLLDRLNQYCRLDLASLQTVGGDRFAPLPVHSVSGGVGR